MATRSVDRPGVRQRLGAAARAAHLGDVRRGWRRLPGRVRGLVPAVVLIGLVATYPLYVETLNDGWLLFPAEIPVIQELPSVSTGVIMIVFVMMAVGLNIVVGYSGLLDLGYVAFYAVGAYTAGWLASGHFQQVKIHFGSAGIAQDQRGIHLSIWLVLILAGILIAILVFRPEGLLGERTPEGA